MQHIELRPDRTLLKPNFDGYKLSLEPIPVLRMELRQPDNQPHRVRPNEQQYSYHHARLFGMQNHLVRDPWAAGQCYYIDSSGMVQRVFYDESIGRLRPLVSVFKLPLASLKRNETTGSYNCSLVFASERLCLLSDGYGTIHVVETGDRTTGREWKAQSVFQQNENTDEKRFPLDGFVLLDARFLVRDGKRQLHCITLQIDHQPEGQSKTVLHWLTFEQQNQTSSPSWGFGAARVLHGGGFPRYCSLDYYATGVLVASDKPFRFVHDSENPVIPEPEQPTEPEAAAESAEVQPHERYPFEWSQTMDEVYIKFVKQENVEYHIAKDKVTDILRVTVNDDVVIDGSQLFAKICDDSTVWVVERNTLEITLQKQMTAVIWPFLFPGGPDETIASDSGRETAAAPDLPPASCLDAPLEECDFGDAGSSEEYFTLERLSCASHAVTHHISLGSGPPLFSMSLRGGLPYALALRHDVDTCLWQLQPPAGEDDCRLQHEGTLHAFGYVQASKRQQKYLACPPDLSYGVICESERRLFIYKGNYGTTGAGLRNRNGPQVAFGQQRFVSLDDGGEILGICCENEVTLLLTETALLTLQLGIEE